MKKEFKEMLYAFQEMPSAVLFRTHNHNILASIFTMTLGQYIYTNPVVDFTAFIIREHQTTRKFETLYLFKDEIQRIIDQYEEVFKPNYLLREYDDILQHKLMNDDGDYIGGTDQLHKIKDNHEFNINESLHHLTKKGKLTRIIHEKISVKNKFNVKYDIFYKNGVKYITTYELVDLLLLDFQDTAKKTIVPAPSIPYSVKNHNNILKWLASDNNNKEDDFKYQQRLMRADHFLQLFDEDTRLRVLEMEMELMIMYLRNNNFEEEADATEELLTKAKLFMWDDDMSPYERHKKKIAYTKILYYTKYQRGNLAIRGHYKVHTKQFNDNIENNNSIKTLDSFVTKNKKKFKHTKKTTLEQLITQDSIATHECIPTNLLLKSVDNQEATWNKNRLTFTYLNPADRIVDKDAVSDEELFALFEPKLKKKKKKKFKKCVEPTSDIICVEPTNDIICVEPTNDIICVEPTSDEATSDISDDIVNDDIINDDIINDDIINDDTDDISFTYLCEIDDMTAKKMQALLTELIGYNVYFSELCQQSKRHIYIIKPLDKMYTNSKYINFRFADSSKQYHAYLNRAGTTVTNITYIANINAR